jgi:phage baseplate assembly protein W
MSFSGMSTSTGKRISGVAHLRQSVRDILTTPIGTRVMREEYGSDIPSLIDQPDNHVTTVRVYAAAATALMRWESQRLRLRQLKASRNRQGQLVLEVSGQYLIDGQDVTLEPVDFGYGGAA